MQRTDAPPPEGSAPPGAPSWLLRLRPNRIAWHLAMLIVRTAAVGMAGWSLYVVATHYGVPSQLAWVAVAVFDGVALGALYQATEAVKAGRSAATAILATLGMAGISVLLNCQHARIIHGGLPAALLFAAPAVGQLVLSALSWGTIRAEARAARGEAPMRLPAFGLWGWILAPREAGEALQQRAVDHVTARPAAVTPAPRDRSARAAIREHLAAMDPAAAIEITAASQPHLDPAGVAELLAAYGITVDALQVALILGRAATPSVTLDRIQPGPGPLPPHGTEQPALEALMRRDTRADMPQVSGLTKASAITTMARHLGGLNAEPATVVQCLAWQGMATDTAYVRTTLSRARAAEEVAAKAAAEEAERKRAEDERRHGNGGYA